jgi:flavin-dependent dehydrogenase
MIVGAGPGGSTCARALAGAGLDVQLFDKQVFPRIKPCAGWVTPAVVQRLGLDLDDYRQHLTLQPIMGFSTGTIGGRPLVTRYACPISYGIRRLEFDDYLLRRSGVACQFESVRRIVRERDRWVINDAVAAPLLVGAGGHFCPVSRHVRGQLARPEGPVESKRLSEVVVVAQEAEFPMTAEQLKIKSFDAEVPEIFFCNDFAGYGWCFRKGEFLNIGLGRTSPENLTGHLKDFCRFLSDRHHVDLTDLPGGVRGHAYRLYADQKPLLSHEGVVLIGDAAGLAHPRSGEGILPAVISAQLAAGVIASNFPDVSAQTLTEYDHQLESELGRVPNLRSLDWLPLSWARFAAQQLMKSSWFARHVVLDNWFLNRKSQSHQITEAETSAPVA